MSVIVKNERFAQQVVDLLNFKYGSNAAAKAYDTSSDVYVKLTQAGTVTALIKFETQAPPASGATNPITGIAQPVFTPDVVRVGLDLGTAATDFFTMTTATGEGVIAKNTATCVTVIATNTVVINGVTFTAIANGAVPAAPTSTTGQFAVGAGGSANNDTATALAAAINAQSNAFPAGGAGNVYAAAATNVVTVYGRFSGTSLNGLATTATGGTITWAATTLGGVGAVAGTAGSTVVINGVTFTSVKHSDYLIVSVIVRPLVGPGTKYFDEGAGTAAQAATAVTAIINALPTALWVNGQVTALVDGGVPAQVDLSAAAGTGLAGNNFTLTKTGTLVTSVNAATFSGAAAVVTPKDTEMYCVALAALTGCEVKVYGKAGVAIADLADANDGTLLITRYRNTEWGFIAHQ